MNCLVSNPASASRLSSVLNFFITSPARHFSLLEPVVAELMASASSYVRHVPSSALHLSRPTWWLESRFHFNFAEYHNPSKTNFGALRVLNDDLVKGKSGFG